MTGVVFHPRFYPNEPAYMSAEYLDIVSRLIMHAKAAGMEFWIYDENGWPSGTAGGEVMSRLPESRCHWVEWKGGTEIAFGSKAAVSSFDRQAADTFIDVTHEGYRLGLASEAFDYVTGFFSDEVAFLDGHGLTVKTGALPWDERFPLIYEQRYGEALIPLLPLLFKDEVGHETVRIRYWEMLTDALIESFYLPMSAWCADQGKRFTAHLKGEENPYFQLSYSGSCFQVLKGIETPAIDALERFPGNHFYPRLAHSVAVQQGRDGCLVEAMGGGGWGVSPQTFSDYVMWLAGHGIDQFVFHLNQLKLKSEAIRDWPPSMPSHMTWRDAFPALLQSIQEQAALLPDLRKTPELLIVTPTRGMMSSFLPHGATQMNEHNGTNLPNDAAGNLSRRFMQLVEDCHAAGIHYELTEERAVEEDGRLANGKLIIGSREYARVLLAEGCRWKDANVEKKLQAAGVKVLHSEDWRTEISGKGNMERFKKVIAYVPAQTAWAFTPPPLNRLLVEFTSEENGGLLTEIALEQAESLQGLSLLLHDPVREIWINGRHVPMEAVALGRTWTVPLSNELLRLRQALEIFVIPLDGGEQKPIVYIQGSFALESRTPFLEKDHRQLTTSGPFAMAPQPASLGSRNLIASGYPYAGLPAKARKSIRIGHKTVKPSRLQLTQVYADAAQISINGQELGWCWGPDWEVLLPEGLKAGSYELGVLLYPSTFNVYGPHRHQDGDRHLISPDQFVGRKNFADYADAPAYTLVERLHFVKWEMTGDVHVLEVEHGRG